MIRKSAKPLFTAALWLIGCVSFFLAASLPVCADRLPVKTYTVADGLLRDYVYKIKQDSRGFLWFCTPGGISRFDGYAFTNFTTADGLPDRHVNDFLESRLGSIWIATDAGIAKLNPHGDRTSGKDPLFEVYLTDNREAKKILVLYEERDGQIFAGTGDGLYRFAETSGALALSKVDLDSSSTTPIEVTAIIQDKDGALWVATHSNGLFRVSGSGSVERFTVANGLPGDNVESLLEDKDGRIWVGMRVGTRAGLCLLVAKPENNQKIVERVFTPNDGLPDSWILALYQARDGQMWVGTTRGLCRWQGEGNNSVCRTYTAKNNICNSDIWALTEDTDGNLWTGTRCGAKKLTRYGFTTYTEEDGVESTYINSIFENSSGELFASSDPANTRNISRFDGERFELIKPFFPSTVSYFGWGTNQTVVQDREGDWWFPTSDGLYRFRNPARLADLSRTIPQRFAPVAGRIEIFRLFEDRHGDFWCSTTSASGNGIWRWERKANVWHDYTSELNFSDGRLAWAFAEDLQGNLWITTGGEGVGPTLVRYRDGAFKEFSEADGVPGGVMMDLFVDGKGRLWIANTSAGLLRLDDVNADRLELVRYSSAEGLSTQGATCVVEDEFGRIYVCTARGLDRLNPENGQIENFTTADGLPNSYPLMAHRDRKNALWFGTTDGLARFQPQPERTRTPPNVLIMGMRVGGLARNVSILGETALPEFELNSDERQVSIDFVGLGSSLGEKLNYEYRFGDTDWTPIAERTVNFANLSSGIYKFEVRAFTTDRNYSRPAFARFRIASPIWQRWWFFTALAVLTIALIYFFYRSRIARLLEIEGMRTRIATDLHDDIGANLTRISLLSEVASQQGSNGAGKKTLPSIARIARESVASMNDIVWAISPDHDSLLDLIGRMRQHSEEIFAMLEVEIVFVEPTADTALKLSVGARRDILLIFKEAVNNVARHSNCTKVEIDFRCEHSLLSLKIKDNGKGLETAANGHSEGQGLRSMARRAAALGGRLTIHVDGGTCLSFEMPLKKAM